MPPSPHPLSRARLTTFHDCRRRFQLRYIERLPWPEAPVATDVAGAGERGRRFHRRLERHFLGLAEPAGTLDEDETIAAWWSSFERHPPRMPDGRRLVELTLTIPLGAHLLVGRYDLLIIAPGGAHIYDWKTGRPPARAELRDDWQTRLYLALLYEGQGALHDAHWSPETINLTYWYASAPDTPHSFVYNAAWHKEVWADLTNQVAALDELLATEGPWPLTDDLDRCRVCAYQVVCGRQDAGRGPLAPPPEDDLDPEPPPPVDQVPSFPG